MKDMKKILYVPVLCGAMILSGCAGTVERSAETSLALPESFSVSGTAASPEQWWLAFEDDQLNQLIDQSLTDNFSLKSSWARLTQARALYDKTRAGLFPTVDGDGSASHSIDYNDGSTTKSDRLSLGLSASYELDLWGRIDSEVEASRLDLEATAADLDAAAMTISAAVAGTWYRLIRQRASLELYDEQIQTNTKALDLISAQFRTGQVPLADVLQQRQLIENQQGQKVQLQSDKGQTEHQLAILLGQVPGAQPFEIPVQFTDLPELPDTGIPVDLIRTRPDIRSSFLSLQAADERVAVAVAEQYPSLRFFVSLDTINNPTSTIFSDYVGSIMASLTAPLFDGGQRKAEVERTRGAAEQSLNDYGQTILTAVGEVEDALLVEQKQQEYIKNLQGQLDLAKQTMAQIKDRYLKGVENYQRVLTALTSLQSLQQQMLTAKADLLLNRIELCRALGTGWGYST